VLVAGRRWIAGFGAALTGSLACAGAPGPFDGPHHVTATLRSDGPHAEADAAAFEARLEHLGVDGSVAVRAPDTVDVALEGVLGPEVLGELVRPYDTQLAGVLDLGGVFGATGIAPDALRPDVVCHDHFYDDGSDASFGCSGARDAILAVVLPGFETAAHCPLDPSDCRLVALDPDGRIGRANIASADVAPGDDPVVIVRLDATGKAGLEALTTRYLSRPIAIVVDREVRVMPRVMEPITAGLGWITLSRGPTAPAEVAALSAALSSPPLRGRWTLETVR
jgi:hypothetical protein